MTDVEEPDNDEKADKPEPSPSADRSKKKKRRSPSKRDSDTRYKIIRAALEDHLIEHARKTDKKKKSLDEISSNVEEFLDTFIILGYDYNGESCTLISANTQQQADSLSTLIQKFIVSSQGPSVPPFYE